MSDEPNIDDLIKELIKPDRKFYYPKLQELTGHVETSLFLSTLLFKGNLQKGWIKVSASDWLKMGFKRSVVEHARKICCDELKIVDKLLKRYDKHGTYHYRINKPRLLAMLNNLSSMQETHTLKDLPSMQENSALYSMQKTNTLLSNKNYKEHKKGKKAEEEKKETKTSTTATPIFIFYESEFGQIKGYMKTILTKAVTDYSEDWVLDALKEAVTYGKKSWPYVESILVRWKKEGKVKTVGNKASTKLSGNQFYLSSNPPNFGKGEPKGFANLPPDTSDATRAAAERIVARKRKKELEEKNMVIL